mmetsp:Transcript_1345/g.3319  ORF Transcript_1345/g.3319 Transcript_1345/m.3319 type:complete len:88 (+) Transcript_1345:54-317(+)
MPAIHDNISSASYNVLAPLPGLGNDGDSLMNQRTDVLPSHNNHNGDAAAAVAHGFVSADRARALDDSAINATATAATTTKIQSPDKS